MNLRHVWGDTDCSGDDFVTDTPLQSGSHSSFNCDEQNTCNETDPLKGYDLRDMHENIMDYSSEDCLYLLTEGQATRMRATLDGSGACRSQMFTNGAVYPTTINPWLFTVDYSGSMTDDIEAVQQTVTELLDALNLQNKDPSAFVLSTFSDERCVCLYHLIFVVLLSLYFVLAL